MNDLVSISADGVTIMSCTSSQDVAHINKYFVFVDFICLFFIPLIIIVFCYTQVIRTLSVPKEKLPPEGAGENQNMKAIKMLLVLMCLFCVCTVAPMIYKIYIMWGPGYFAAVNIVENAVYMFSYSNSWFNLIVFAYFRDDLRRSFTRMIKTSCLARMGRKIWSRDGHMTASQRSDELKLENEGESHASNGNDVIMKPSEQDNTLIMMEF